MHQPYYKNLLTNETEFPWVRFHGTKDYLDMIKIAQEFPDMKLTVNLVPSLLEQIEDYQNDNVKDKFLLLSYKPAAELNHDERKFLLDNFFMINKETVIKFHPRYYELLVKKDNGQNFSDQDYLDLQVWFNLAWIDPYFRESIPELLKIVHKARFFTEKEKCTVLDKQLEILKEIIPAYKDCIKSKQIEIILSPFYHPILPLLYNTNIAKEANVKSTLPAVNFSYPEDAKAQVDLAVEYFKSRFGADPIGMWPSEESVSEHIIHILIKAGIKWIVTDEAILFKSLHIHKRDTKILYHPHYVETEDGILNIVFRDRNLSDLIGFEYAKWAPKDAAADFVKHIENIAVAYKDQNVLVTIAMDGENAWEYFVYDGHPFLRYLYKGLTESKLIKTTTVNEYLKLFPAEKKINRLGAGSWIYGEFSKWINNPCKNRGWEYLALARKELEEMRKKGEPIPDLAWKQIHVAEGSDWYWWFGEDYPGYFDRLYRMHMSNFYTIINKPIPEYLKHPI